MRQHSTKTIRRARYRAAASRAAKVPRRVVASVDPFDAMAPADLDVWVEAATEVMRAAAPRVKPEMAKRWAKPIRRELRALVEDIQGALPVSKSRFPFLAKAGPDDIEVPDSVFRKFERGMRGVLEDMHEDVGRAGWEDATERIGVELDYSQRGNLTTPSQDRIGTKVTQIVEASRAMLAGKISTAVERGYSVEQTVEGVPGDGYEGLREMVDRWQAEAPVETTTDRATLIALTETANAYNYGALDAYTESRLVEEVNVFDGAECGWTEHDDPDAAHGSRRTIEEAEDYPISHPHCQRSFGPVVEGAPAAGRPGSQDQVPAPQVDPKPGSSELETRARAIAAAKFDQAGKAEEDVTALMQGIEADGLGQLAGLDNRLKLDTERTAEKIEADVLAGNPLAEARQVKDALRYTLVNDEASLYANAEATITRLQDEGYVVIKWKDNMDSLLSKDINSALKAPDGSRFELQFHTPTTLERKFVGGPDGQRASHDIYDELRALPEDDPGRQPLEAELRALWEGVPPLDGTPFKPEVVDDFDD